MYHEFRFKDGPRGHSRQEDTQMVTQEQMINYLQQMMDRVQNEIKRYGADDRMVEHRIDAMIACKEMVEAFIQQPVNLQKDGKVTVGF